MIQFVQLIKDHHLIKLKLKEKENSFKSNNFIKNFTISI